MPNHRYDVLVVGAGHAGIEAAGAAARLGCRVGLVSGNLDTIGKLSCNPAMGGLAKGQLIREIDALGGAMGHLSDAAGIHFRRLGTSKGPAMWSPRAQADKVRYQSAAKQWVESCAGIHPIQGDVRALRTDDQRRVTGIGLADGRELHAPRVVLTTGTFLQALMHQGDQRLPGGRMGEAPALGLSADLAKLELPLIRLKTGTPMRILADSIAFDHCEEQPGEDQPQSFAFEPRQPVSNQIVCWTCRTTPEAHAAITANLDRAPMYNGQIDSAGPRYCPSIEDKVVRFADRESHLLHLEPEGVSTGEVYVNGLSTSLPVDVQDQVLAAIPALTDAHVMRYGYAVEYDAVSTSVLDHTLAVPSVPGLSLAGQINGTSGYEEAGIQGLLAGANAALSLSGAEPLVLSRADAYAGVLVDDLVARVPEEPYRMFTSRAEHRLHLRSDNADRRLTPLAARCGLVDQARAERLTAKVASIDALIARTPDATARQVSGEALSLDAACAVVPGLNDLPGPARESAWIDLRYRGYLERQQATIDRLARQRDLPLPADFDATQVPAISNEARRLWCDRQPRTLGEASMIAGVRPADVETLHAWLQHRQHA